MIGGGGGTGVSIGSMGPFFSKSLSVFDDVHDFGKFGWLDAVVFDNATKM